MHAGRKLIVNRMTAHLAAFATPDGVPDRVRRLVSEADLSPAGFPPAGILLVRRLPDPLPGQVGADPEMLRLNPVWMQAVRKELRSLWDRAGRPVMGTVTGGSDAVCFLDHAELLAALAVDLRRGEAAQRWWWRSGAPLVSQGGLAGFWRELGTEAHLLPAVLGHLLAWRQLESLLRSLDTGEAMRLGTAVAQAHGLPNPWRAGAGAASSRPGPLSSPWVAAVDQSLPAGLSRPVEAMAGIALSLWTAPAVVRDPHFMGGVATFLRADGGGVRQAVATADSAMAAEADSRGVRATADGPGSTAMLLPRGPLPVPDGLPIQLPVPGATTAGPGPLREPGPAGPGSGLESGATLLSEPAQLEAAAATAATGRVEPADPAMAAEAAPLVMPAMADVPGTTGTRLPRGPLPVPDGLPIQAPVPGATPARPGTVRELGPAGPGSGLESGATLLSEPAQFEAAAATAATGRVEPADPAMAAAAVALGMPAMADVPGTTDTRLSRGPLPAPDGLLVKPLFPGATPAGPGPVREPGPTGRGSGPEYDGILPSESNQPEPAADALSPGVPPVDNSLRTADQVSTTAKVAASASHPAHHLLPMRPPAPGASPAGAAGTPGVWPEPGPPGETALSLPQSGDRALAAPADHAMAAEAASLVMPAMADVPGSTGTRLPDGPLRAPDGLPIQAPVPGATPAGPGPVREPGPTGRGRGPEYDGILPSESNQPEPAADALSPGVPAVDNSLRTADQVSTTAKVAASASHPAHHLLPMRPPAPGATLTGAAGTPGVRPEPGPPGETALSLPQSGDRALAAPADPAMAAEAASLVMPAMADVPGTTGTRLSRGPLPAPDGLLVKPPAPGATPAGPGPVRELRPVGPGSGPEYDGSLPSEPNQPEATAEALSPGMPAVGDSLSANARVAARASQPTPHPLPIHPTAPPNARDASEAAVPVSPAIPDQLRTHLRALIQSAEEEARRESPLPLTDQGPDQPAWAAPAGPPVVSVSPGDFGVGIETGLGGVLFLVNLMRRLRLPGCCERDWQLESVTGAWGNLEVLARGLLAPDRSEFCHDPLWRLLAWADGREPGALPRAANGLLSAFQLPADWVRSGEEPGGAHVSPAVDHPAATEEALLNPWLHGLHPHLMRWVKAASPYVRQYLTEMLEQPPDADLGAMLLEVPGIVYATPTHIDLVMDVRHASVPVRLAGLDTDPGWDRDFWRIISFHFR